MKQPLQASGAPVEQPQGHAHGSLRLDDCGDVLTLRELCRVLQISDRTYRHLRQHGAFPIPALGTDSNLRLRFAKAAVARFLEGDGLRRLRRVS